MSEKFIPWRLLKSCHFEIFAIFLQFPDRTTRFALRVDMTHRQPTPLIFEIKSDFSCCNGYSVFPWGEQTMFLLASQRWHFMLIYASQPKTCRLRRNWKIPFNMYLGYCNNENGLRFEKGRGAHSRCWVSSLFALWGTSLISRNRSLFLSRYLGLGGRQNAHDS